jgi:hypothetical protein
MIRKQKKKEEGESIFDLTSMMDTLESLSLKGKTTATMTAFCIIQWKHCFPDEKDESVEQEEGNERDSGDGRE